MRDDRDVTVIETGSSGLKWFVIGAVLGASLGVLFAPEAGDQTRRTLARKGRKLRARAESAVEDLTDDVQARGKRLKESVHEFADEVRGGVSEAGRKLERGAADAREVMERRLAEARSRARAALDAGDEDDEDVVEEDDEIEETEDDDTDDDDATDEDE